MEIPAAAGELREIGWKYELNSLFHRACSAYFHSISRYFYLISILFLPYFHSISMNFYRIYLPYFNSVLLLLPSPNTFSILEFQFP
jgi:hypothetical protein